jgi:hypothetical protein
MAIDTNVLAQIAIVAVSTTAGMSLIGVAVHAYWNRVQRGRISRPAPPMDDSRLMRLEQAVESIAIEVERISEGQRFLTRLQTGAAADVRASQNQLTGG